MPPDWWERLKEADWNKPLCEVLEDRSMDDLSYIALYTNIAITIIIAIRFCIAATRCILLRGVNNSHATGAHTT